MFLHYRCHKLKPPHDECNLSLMILSQMIKTNNKIKQKWQVKEGQKCIMFKSVTHNTPPSATFNCLTASFTRVLSLLGSKMFNLKPSNRVEFLPPLSSQSQILVTNCAYTPIASGCLLFCMQIKRPSPVPRKTPYSLVPWCDDLWQALKKNVFCCFFFTIKPP